MPINFNPLTTGRVHHNTKIRVYPDGGTKIIYCSMPIFREKGVEVVEKNDDLLTGVYYTPPCVDELQNSREEQKQEERERDRTNELIRRHRDRVRDIVLCNDFTHFLTITINPEKIDSFDVAECKKKLHKWLNNQVERKGLKYVLIPEYHDSGRLHCHALVNDVFKLVPAVSPYTGKNLYTTSGKQIFNVPEWRYGFSTSIALDSQKWRVANYVCKYITKGSDKIFGKYFWSSKNIQREPLTFLDDMDFSAVDTKEYKPVEWLSGLSFKYESSLEYKDESNDDYSDFDECAELATDLEENT